MNRILWNDLETTGTDPKRSAIIQIASAVEDNGRIIETFNRKMRPHIGAQIDPKALEVNGHTFDEISKFDSPDTVYGEFYSFLNRNGFCKIKHKRFIPAGYNNKFDLDFLSEWFARQSGGPWAFWDFLQFNPIDPLPIIVMLWRYGKIDTVDCKLPTVCKYFDIPLQAHDALSDLMATRDLTRIIVDKYFTHQINTVPASEPNKQYSPF